MPATQPSARQSTPATPHQVADGTVSPTAARTRGSLFTICGSAHLIAAAAVAALNLNAPFTRGWWLVAYLSLVGGISQLLLGPGLIAIARKGGAAVQEERAWRLKLLLWNAGTIMVAAASMARIPAGVPAGSLLLFAALALFAAAGRTVRASADGTAAPWLRLYSWLLGFLCLSILVGNYLAYRGYR